MNTGAELNASPPPKPHLELVDEDSMHGKLQFFLYLSGKVFSESAIAIFLGDWRVRPAFCKHARNVHHVREDE
jgi:hypothetical protein